MPSCPSLSSLQKKYSDTCDKIDKYTSQRDEIKQKINELQQERDRLRSIPIKYEEFAKLAGHSLDLWNGIEVDDVYHDYKKCQVDDCWYQGNTDRLDELELYSCNGMNDELGDDWTICNVCWENNFVSEIIERHHDEDTLLVYVLPNDLQSARKKYAEYEEEEKQKKEQETAKKKKEREDRISLWNTTLQENNGNIKKTTKKTTLIPCDDCHEIIDLFESHHCEKFTYHCEDKTRCWSCDCNHRVYDHSDTLKILNKEE